jgi:hypothetical protein
LEIAMKEAYGMIRPPHTANAVHRACPSRLRMVTQARHGLPEPGIIAELDGITDSRRAAE